MRFKESEWSRYGYSTEFVYGLDHITRTQNKLNLRFNFYRFCYKNDLLKSWFYAIY